jgi:hypothetical protein
MTREQGEAGMDQQVTRRTLLAGAGAAAGAVAVGALAPKAGASPLRRDGDGLFGPGEENGSLTTAMAPSAFTPTPGLAYLVLDPTELEGPAGAERNLSVQGAQPTAATTALLAPLRLPIGAALKEVTMLYLSPTTAFLVGVYKLVVGAAYAQPVAPTPAPAGAGPLSVTHLLDEPVMDGSASYFVVVTFTGANQIVQGLRIGYVPPAQAFVPISPVHRVLDTRLSGGKLGPNEERIVPLGVPSFAKAAVTNLTVTDTEQAGFVAVFPANVAWPGNSSINWSETGQNLANGVITATDATGNVKIRGGVSPTHVVVDVQGYLL